jgi:hypothetical protein
MSGLSKKPSVTKADWLQATVETVVLLSHKNADTHININVEFEDEE